MNDGQKTNKKKQENEGITLIALIITIIILVILAAVSIRAIYNMGIVGRAVNGTQDYAREAVKEEDMLDSTGKLLKETLKNIARLQGADVKYDVNPSTYDKYGSYYYNSPDLSGFEPSSTYYVTYDANGNNEKVLGRIDKVEAKGNKIVVEGEETNNIWFDYENKIWANIVTVTGNDVTYWVWIPRYKYTENTSAKTTDVRFVGNADGKTDVCYRDINGEKTEIDVSDYTLPESFKFGDINLTGYWVSKYEIQEVANEIVYTIGNGETRKVTTTNPNGKYTVYLEGEKLESGVNLPYTITGLTKDKKYDICLVSETNSKMIGRTISSTDVIQVDLSGFNPECTYYVLYDQDGTNERIGGKIQVDSNGNVKIPDSSNGVWYDYNRKIWANVVTKGKVTDENGNEKEEIAYWTYIPRYEYIEFTNTKTTSIHFIPVTQITATNGWTIPDSFKFGQDENGNDIQLKGYWVGKYEVQ